MYKELADRLRCSLNLKRRIVGIKLFADKTEYLLNEDEESKFKVSYCYMVNLASRGRSVKVKYEHFNCQSSARALGLVKPEARHVNGEEYFSYGLYKDMETAREVQENVLYIPDEVYGMVVKPIEEFKERCDVIIIIADSYSAMRVVQGYTFSYGPFGKVFSVANQGVCSELTARPYIYKDLNISFLCSNSRFYCGWNDHDMGIAFPEEMYEGISSGILETINSSETDKRKKDIIDNFKEHGIEQDIVLGKNYFLDTTIK